MERNKIPRVWKRVLFLLSILTLLAAVALYRGLVVRKHEVITGKGVDIRFVLVSDLHAARYGDGQRDILDLIRDQRPDAILMAGDMIDDASSNEPTMEFMKGAADIAPCFYSSGSHDLWSEQYYDGVRTMKGWGITILSGDTAVFDIHGQRINISGIGDPTTADIQMTGRGI